MVANLSILRKKEKIIYEYVFNLSFQTKESAGSTDTDDHVILNLSLASGILLFFISLFIRSIFWNGAVLFEVLPCERNPSAFQLFKRILAPLSLLISYIMTPNISTLLLIRKRILILNLMLLHRKKQKSKKSAWGEKDIRRPYQERRIPLASERFKITWSSVSVLPALSLVSSVMRSFSPRKSRTCFYFFKRSMWKQITQTAHA